MKLAGKVAIVTGSARGIGKAIAMKFASEGASVVVADINVAEARQVVNEIKNQGGTAIALKTDVSKKEEVQNLVRSTLESYKAIHILVNNAGIPRHAPFLEMTEEDWDAVLAVDLKGTFFCTQAVLPHMMEQRYGKIISMSSGAGTEKTAAHGNVANYAAAKAGIIQLAKVAAREGGPYGINANAIAPGTVLTPRIYEARGVDTESWCEQRRQQMLLGRLGEPEDIANLALFLASDDSSWITGQVICCDGGGHDRL